MEQESGGIKLYSDVEAVPVKWLWYPFIPGGKITVIQGDPGDGKSTMVMNLIAAFTTAGQTPDGKTVKKPMKVIYQCSEDGLADTIKPRLVSSGADCTKVAFLDESVKALTLDDTRIRDAIKDFGADLLVVDPIQAYFGDNADLSNPKKARRMLHVLGTWAEFYDCAIILIGHLNKREGGKELYRSLGSIDLMAAARSVLQISRLDEMPSIRRLKQIKNSLAPRGNDVMFTIDQIGGFKWLCEMPSANDEQDSSAGTGYLEKFQVPSMLKKLLSDGPVKATDVEWYFSVQNISMRTVNRVKKSVGVKSVRIDGRWYWKISD